MATATQSRKTRQAGNIALREDWQRPDQPLKVDRDRGIIFRVKVLGPDSPNNHGKPVDGTDYLPSAHVSLCEAIRQPGGMPVNKNHTEKNNPNRDRTLGERFGWLENPVTENQTETYADLHLLKSDPDSAKLFEAAERNPHCFALSVNGDGHFEIKNRRLVIDKFTRLPSVDAVTNGGSTVSLAESNRARRRGRRTMTLKESLAKIGIKGKASVRLFELGDGTLLKPDAPADEMPAAGGDEDDADYCAHLGKAIVAIINDDSLDAEAKKKKVMGILKLTTDDDSEGETPTEESDEETDQKEDTGEDAEGTKGDDTTEKKEKPVKESLTAKVHRLERSEAVTTLCESLAFTPTPIQRKALVALREANDRKALAETFKASGGKGTATEKAKGTGLPRTTTDRTVTTRESAMPKDAKEQATLLLRAS